MLDGVVALNVQRQGLGAEVPGHALRAGRSSERAVVLINTVGVQVPGECSEIELAGLSVGTRSGNVVNVGKDRVKQGGGVTELGELEDEANDGDGAS